MTTTKNTPEARIAKAAALSAKLTRVFGVPNVPVHVDMPDGTMEVVVAPTETVLCEEASHSRRGHPMVPECVWPHIIAPAGAQPSLGHPLTPHE